MAFEVLRIPSAHEDAKTYIEQYKTFRLLSLKTSPRSFHSTYDREIQFTDDVWMDRLTNPDCCTFVAFQSGKIVCTLTLVGPLNFEPDDLHPSTSPMELNGGSPQPFAHWRFNGMFTLPEARGQGVAKALIKMGQEYGETRAAESKNEFVGSIVTESDNTAAVSLYEKCGFVIIKEQPYVARGEDVVCIIMQYPPPGSTGTILSGESYAS